MLFIESFGDFGIGELAEHTVDFRLEEFRLVPPFLHVVINHLTRLFPSAEYFKQRNRVVHV